MLFIFMYRIFPENLIKHLTIKHHAGNDTKNVFFHILCFFVHEILFFKRINKVFLRMISTENNLYSCFVHFTIVVFISIILTSSSCFFFSYFGETTCNGKSVNRRWKMTFKDETLRKTFIEDVNRDEFYCVTKSFFLYYQTFINLSDTVNLFSCIFKFTKTTTLNITSRFKWMRYAPEDYHDFTRS